MVEKSRKEFIYRIDADHRLTFINNAWFEFAIENGVQDLQPEKVLNRPIWDFISDRETKHLLDLLIKKLNSKASSIELPFRCDSPDCRRFMQMQMSFGEDNQIRFRNWIVKEENRPAVELLVMPRQVSDKLLKMCSWCKKIQTADEAWHEVEKAIDLLGLFNQFPLPQITHSICKPCYAYLESKVDSF